MATSAADSSGTATSSASVPDGSADRIWTIPNALSVLRLLGVPLFLWLLLGPQADGWALAVLMVAGFTDWADGVLARRLNQYSRLGALLDPLADRLYILATLVGLVLRDIIPLWLAVIIIGRDVILAGFVYALRRHGIGAAGGQLPRQGGHVQPAVRVPAAAAGLARRHPVGGREADRWAFTIWGTALYVYTGVLYAVQARHEVARAVAREQP